MNGYGFMFCLNRHNNFLRIQEAFPRWQDPLLKNKFPVKILNQILGVVVICLQEEPSVRPLISNVVATLGYLTLAQEVIEFVPSPLPVSNQLSEVNNSSEPENHHNHGQQDENSSSDEQDSDTSTSHHEDGDSIRSSNYDQHGDSAIINKKSIQKNAKDKLKKP
ncbi:Receptor-like kinase LIP1 [Camellia lanceoleosa]|uniref:Receptor-like kinase LIP1 n=1 Tax=Camellia lanceoleosa TaxID=1840588 RepID=A0ACC0GZW9_9ERIC|nr:Receptor-like kinase LIP1 [Camellia lanceoleosa]